MIIIVVENHQVLYIMNMVPVTLVIWHAIHMHRIMSSVACPGGYHIFPQCLIKGTIFGEKISNIKFIF